MEGTTLETYERKLNRFGQYEKQENVREIKTDHSEKTSLGAISLTLGIISILAATFYYISLPAAILGLIFGVKSVRRVGSKTGKAGEILSTIGLALCIFLYVSVILLTILASADL